MGRLVLQIARHSIQCLPVLLFICEHRKQCNDIVLQEVCMMSGQPRSVPALVDPESRLLVSGAGTVLKYLCRLTGSSWYPQSLPQQALVDQHLETFTRLFQDLRTTISNFVIHPVPGHYELVRPTLIRVVEGLTRLDAECRKILIRRRRKSHNPSTGQDSSSSSAGGSRMSECYFLPGSQSPSLADVVALCSLLQLNLMKYMDVRTHWPSLHRWTDIVARRLGSEFYSLAGPEWGVLRGTPILQGRHQTVQLQRRKLQFPNGIPGSSEDASEESSAPDQENGDAQEEGAEELTGSLETVDEAGEEDRSPPLDSSKMGLSPSLSGLMASNLKLHKLAYPESEEEQQDLPSVIGASPLEDASEADGLTEDYFLDDPEAILDGTPTHQGNGGGVSPTSWEIVPSPSRRARSFTRGSLSTARTQAQLLLRQQQQQQNSISATNIALYESLVCCEHLLDTVDFQWQRLERCDSSSSSPTSSPSTPACGPNEASPPLSPNSGFTPLGHGGKLTPQQWQTELLRIQTFVPKPLGPKAKSLFSWPPDLPNTEAISQSSQYILAQGRVPASVESVAEFLRLPESLQLLSQNSRNSNFGVSVVALCDGQTRLAGGRLQLHHRTAIGNKTARFDFNLALHHLSLRDRTHVASYVSCPEAGIHIKRPPGYVRARILQAGWVVRPVDPVVSYPNPALEERGGDDPEDTELAAEAAHWKALLEDGDKAVPSEEEQSSTTLDPNNAAELEASPTFTSLMHQPGFSGTPASLASFTYRRDLLGGRLEAQPHLQPSRLTGLTRPLPNRNPLEDLLLSSSSSSSGGDPAEEDGGASGGKPSTKLPRKKSQKNSSSGSHGGEAEDGGGPVQPSRQLQQGDWEQEAHVSFVLHVAFPARVSAWIPEKLRQLPPEYIAQLQAMAKFGKLK